MTMMDDVQELVKLKETKASLEAELKAVKEGIAEAEERITAAFADMGVNSLNADTPFGRKTVYTSTMIVARNLLGPDETAQACKDGGLGHMVKERVNPQTLSAYLREMADAGEPLPDSFTDVVEPYEKSQVGVRST